jgi:hypothetical protein
MLEIVSHAAGELQPKNASRNRLGKKYGELGKYFAPQ